MGNVECGMGIAESEAIGTQYSVRSIPHSASVFRGCMFFCELILSTRQSMSGRCKRAARSGQTLLELVAATTIIAIALVPALRMMRDSLRIGRETETANLLATLAASRLEEYLLLSAGQWGDIPAGNNWNTTTVSGNYTADGYPNLKFSVDRTDVAPSGIPATLLSITATVWNDLDNDNVLDAGEPRSVFATKIARNVAYTNEADGT